MLLYLSIHLGGIMLVSIIVLLVISNPKQCILPFFLNPTRCCEINCLHMLVLYVAPSVFSASELPTTSVATQGSCQCSSICRFILVLFLLQHVEHFPAPTPFFALFSCFPYPIHLSKSLSAL